MLTRVSKKGWDFLSSRDLTILLFGLGGLYYLALLIALGAEAVTLTRGITLWGGEKIDISQLVAATLYGKLFFALLILNLAARLAKSFLAERDKFSPEFAKGVDKDFITNLDDHQVISFTPIKTDVSLGQKIFTLVRSQGYHLTSSQDEQGWKLYAAKGNHLFWSKLLLKAGLLIFLTGSILSMSTRTVSEVYLGEGQTINLRSPVLSPSRYSWIPSRAGEISSGQLPWTYLQAERVDPGLTKNFQPKSKSLVFSHQIKTLISFSPNLKRTISIHPPRYINGYYLFLTRFGFGPGIWIMDNRGRDIYMGFQVLEIFPPGAEDTFRVSGLPYRKSVV